MTKAFSLPVQYYLFTFISYFSLLIKFALNTTAILYMSLTSIGFMLVLFGGTLLSRDGSPKTLNT